MTQGKYIRTEIHKKSIRDNHWSKNPIIREKMKKEMSLRFKGKEPWNKGKKGLQIAWNKGLTKEIDKRIKKYSNSLNGHIINKKTKEKISNSNSKTWKKKYKEGYISNMLGKYHTLEWKKQARLRRQKIVLPKKDTSIEVKIQNFLKQLKIDFFTHQYIKIKHGYQCDILIPSMNLVIECDGNYWHKYPIRNDIDHIRTNELIEKGFKILRLWEYEIKKMNLNKFKDKLKNV